jgi:hypothetical protein
MGLTWPVRLLLLLAVLALAPLYGSGAGVAKSAAVLHDAAIAASSHAVAMRASEAEVRSIGEIGCCRQNGGDSPSAHHAGCTQPCASGCGLALAVVSHRAPAFRATSPKVLFDGDVCTSVASEPAFRPPIG